MKQTRHHILLSAIACNIILLLSGCFPRSTERTYLCSIVEAAPVIDGRLDDATWERLPADSGFLGIYNETYGVNYPPTQQSRVKVGYDEAFLYLGILCEEPWIQYLKEGAPDGDTFVKEDGVEVVLQPGRGRPLYHFIVNARGGKWSNLGSGTDLQPWEAAGWLGEDFYSIEIKIPFGLLSEKPDPDDRWKWNIGRNILVINAPENRKTSWSPVVLEFDEPESMGVLRFSGTSSTPSSAIAQEAELAAAFDLKLTKVENKLEAAEQSSQEALMDYYKELRERETGISSISRTPVDLVEPPDVPEGETWRYGLGFPLQIGPREAALLTNIRMEGSGNIDFEIGTDVVIFDDIGEIGTDRVVPASRYERGVDPESGSYVVRKGPILGGFVPFGALLEDGSPHPHAGTGFGMCWAIRHQVDEAGRFDYLHNVERYAMLFQFSYDGKTFRVVDRHPVDAATMLQGWKLVGNFVTNAIPDGEDLLYVMIARIGELAVAGVSRWQRGVEGWHPVSFTPVTGTAASWSEPSLVRETDGSLLLSARGGDRSDPIIAFDIGVWRSVDNGSTWDQIIYEKDRRARSPVSINIAADGSPYIAGNIPALRRTREILCLWPLNDERDGLTCRMPARNAPEEFGPAPSGSWWRIDHPNSAVLRLADGLWRGVLVYRIVDNGEVEGDALPAPETGCYVEEVLSLGKAIPIWKFRD